MTRLIALLALLFAAEPAMAQDGRGLVDRLNADLLGHDSATAVLQGWCDAHGPGGLKITAQRVRGEDKPAPEDVRAALMPAPGEVLGYRRVRLACGQRVLSEADNWYRPSRLTLEMNQVLDTSDTPFGLAVRALDFKRRNLSATVLWRTGPVPAQVLQHRAVLSTPDGTPFSYVVETYTGETVQMALPKPR